MKSYLSLLVIAAMLNGQCRKNLVDIPPCVQQRIAAIKQEAKWNPPAEVHEYIYNNEHVFLFTSNCCDQYIMLYDGNCKYLCAPSGGITGKGDGKCTDFYESATHVRMIWKDDR